MKPFFIITLRLSSGVLGLIFPLIYSKEIGIEGKALVTGIFTISIFINQILILPILFYGRKKSSLENIRTNLPEIVFTTVCLATLSLPGFLFIFEYFFVPGYSMSGGLFLSYLFFLFGHSMLLVANELIISSDKPSKLLMTEVLLTFAILIWYLILVSIDLSLELDTIVVFCVGSTYLFFGISIIWTFFRDIQIQWRIDFLPLMRVYRTHFIPNLTRTTMMSMDRLLISFLLPFETLGKYFVIAATLSPIRRTLDLWSQLPQKLNETVNTRVLKKYSRNNPFKILVVAIPSSILLMFLTGILVDSSIKLLLGPEWSLGLFAVVLIFVGELSRAILSQIQLKNLVYGHTIQKRPLFVYYVVFAATIYVATQMFGINGFLLMLISFHLFLFQKHVNLGKSK